MLRIPFSNENFQEEQSTLLEKALKNAPSGMKKLMIGVGAGMILIGGIATTAHAGNVNVNTSIVPGEDCGGPARCATATTSVRANAPWNIQYVRVRITGNGWVQRGTVSGSHLVAGDFAIVGGSGPVGTVFVSNHEYRTVGATSRTFVPNREWRS